MNNAAGAPRQANPARARLRWVERRELVLDAALEIATERSLGALTMEEVASRAGVSKQVLYRHIPDAGALRLALFDREVSRFAATAAAAVGAANGLEARLGALLDTWLATVSSSGRVLSSLLFTDLDDADFVTHRQSGRGALVSWLAHEIQAGAPMSQDRAQLLAEMLIGAANALTSGIVSGRLSKQIARSSYLELAMAAITATSPGHSVTPPPKGG